jgi:hypothetical protein
MKRKILFIAAGIFILVLSGLISLRTMIRQSVKQHIKIAQERYEGGPEDALIAMLLDEKTSFHEKTHTAIWTLGQLESEKALPILREMYKDDPEGETCYGKHDSVVCQYEIYKAITAIEKFSLFHFRRLK